MFLLLILSIFHTFSSVSIVDFKQVNLDGLSHFTPKVLFVPFYSILDILENLTFSDVSKEDLKGILKIFETLHRNTLN